MSLRERPADGAEAEAEAEATSEGDRPESGIDTYEVVEPMDGTGRMRVGSDGSVYTVVGSSDQRVANRLSDRAPGATVRMELSPAPSGHGYVAARVKPGGLLPL